MNYKDYRNAWDNADKEYPAVPLHVDLEISSVCNLKCGFCFLQNKKYKKPRIPFMPVRQVKMMIDRLARIGVPAIKFNWRGEATIHPNFTEIAEYAQGKFQDIRINTNGQYAPHIRYTLRHFDKIAYSVDSLSPATYEKIRKGKLSVLLDNLMYAAGAYRDKIEIRRVVCPENEKEPFKAQADSLFHGVPVIEHDVFDRAHFERKVLPRKFCGQPNRRIIIATNGDVFPCCVDYMGNLKLGNIWKDAFSTLWTRARSLAYSLQHGAWPEACQNCASYASYACKSAQVLK